MHKKVKVLRDKYLKSLGNRNGTVILKRRKANFSEELVGLQKGLDKFRNFVQTRLEEEFGACKENLKTILRPIVAKNPPDELVYGILSQSVDEQTVEMYLDKKLEAIIPAPADFVSEMNIRCQFKDVTYETLKDENFISSLQSAFPYEGLPLVPVTEFRAAPAKKEN